MTEYEAMAARLDGPGIADYELDPGIAHEAAAMLRKAAQEITALQAKVYAAAIAAGKERERVRELESQLADAQRDMRTLAIAHKDNSHELEEIIKELEKDAQRYRWLRAERLSGRNGMLFAQAMGWKLYQMWPNEVDAAIDAAMKGQQ